MKRLAYAICLMTAITCSVARMGSADDVDGYIFNSAALAITTGPVFNVGNLNRLSVQVAYSSATTANVAFTEGTKSTASITVGTNFALLADATAAVTIKVVSNTSAITGACITINGQGFCEGTHWTKQSTATGTAKSIETALNQFPILTSTASYGGTSSDTVRSSATVYGTYANSYTIVSSTPAALLLSGAVFSGGRDRGWVNINGTQLYAGLDFAVGSSTAATAENIARAMNANATIGAITSSTSPLSCIAFPGFCGVVRSTSTVPGLNAYSLSTSSQPILTPSGSIYQAGAASNIDSVNDIITKANTFQLGQDSWIGGTAPTGLTANTTYFAIPVLLGTSFKLATTRTNAAAGTAIDISTTSLGGGSYTLTASTCTTGASFVLQQSNDGSNWVTATSTGTLATITVGPPSGITSAYFDLGAFSARYLKFNFTPPTSGGLVTDISVHGKR